MAMVRAYLKKAEAEKKIADDGKPNHFFGFRTHSDDNVTLFFYFDTTINEIPEEVKPFVSFFTCCVFIPPTPHRELGKYSHGSAWGYVDTGHDDFSKIKIFIKSENPEDLLELLRKIRTGTIRPDESCEGSQIGISQETLEASCASLEEQLDDERKENRLLNCQLNALKDLRNRLDQENLAICWKATVVKEIEKILSMALEEYLQ